MPVFGLIGKKLEHSFSKAYFTEKFETLGLKDHVYNLYELEEIKAVKELFSLDSLQGLNVTVPYKQAVMPFLDKLDTSAEKVGAVNVIKLTDGKKTGYNSDYYGFKESLTNWLDSRHVKALVLGTGGASKAVTAALEDLQIPFKLVSRSKGSGDYTYDDLQENEELTSQHQLIINTTPLGMFPNVDKAPALPYSKVTEKHYFYDLVYNPEKTSFLTLGEANGAKIKNGLEMLHLQAEKSWEIWNN